MHAGSAPNFERTAVYIATAQPFIRLMVVHLHVAIVFYATYLKSGTVCVHVLQV